MDRISEVRPLGTKLPVPPPPHDAAMFVTEALAQGPRRYQVRIRLFTSAELARRLIKPTVGRVDEDGDDCVLTLGTDDLGWAARWLVYRSIDFDVLDPPELIENRRALGRWLADR